MADASVEPWITDVQNTIGSLIEKPKMVPKYLQKPPFKYLHDIIKAVLEVTGFGAGQFSENELNGEVAGADKTSKLAFLDKISELVSQQLGRPSSLMPMKTIAGHEAERTCAFLVELHTVATGNGGSTPAVTTAAPVAAASPPPTGPTPEELAAAKQKEEERERRRAERDAEKKRLAAEAAAKEALNASQQSAPPAPPPTGGPASKAPKASLGESQHLEVPQPASVASAGGVTSSRPMTASNRRPPRATTKREMDSLEEVEAEKQLAVHQPSSSTGPAPGRRIFAEGGADSDSDTDMMMNSAGNMGQNQASGRQPRRMPAMLSGDASSDEEDGAGRGRGGVMGRMMAGLEAQKRHLAADMGGGSDGDEDEEGFTTDPFEVTGHAIGHSGGALQQGGRSPGITFKRKTNSNKQSKTSMTAEVQEMVAGLQLLVDGTGAVGKTMSALEVIRGSVRAEIENCKVEAEERSRLLKEAQDVSKKEISKLDLKLSALNDSIAVAEAKISDARERILRNEARISKMLTAVVAN